jgi:hypothetical protein
MRHRRQRLRLGASAACLALLLGACGDDAGSSGDPASADAFCDTLRELEASDVFDSDPDFSDPEAVRAQYEAFRDGLTDLQSAAPDEIADDVAAIRTSLVDLIELLDEYDYDLEAIFEASTSDPALAERLESFGDPAIEEATARLDTFGEQDCGITPDTTG